MSARVETISLDQAIERLHKIASNRDLPFEDRADLRTAAELLARWPASPPPERHPNYGELDDLLAEEVLDEAEAAYKESPRGGVHALEAAIRAAWNEAKGTK